MSLRFSSFPNISVTSPQANMASVEEEMEILEEAFHFGGLLSFFLALFIGCILNKMCPRFKWDQSPPGPAEFRGIGNIHQIARGNATLSKIQRWRGIYGDVFALSLNNYKMVILSGYDTIKEAYSMPQFSKRLLVKPFHAIGCSGEKSEWATVLPQDKDVLRRLKNLSVGNISEAIMVHQNITELAATIKKLRGQSFVPHKMLSCSVAKSLYNVISGKMTSSEDIRCQTVLNNVNSIITSSSIHTGPSFVLSTVFPHLSNSVTNIKSGVLGNSYDDNEFNQNGAASLSVKDAYLTSIKDIQITSKTEIKDGQSVSEILNLLAVASETASNTVIWAIYYLIRYPPIQEQLYQEVYTVLGRKREPSLDDLESCPFAQAVIEEVFRVACLSPLGYFHQSSEDTMFQGHFIPKNTLICSNVYALHNDKKIWGDPDNFRPDRHLLSNPANGKLQRNLHGHPVIPFSITRSSLGEVLTRNYTFLYLTSLVQKFQFRTSSDDKSFKRLESGSDLMRAPREFNIIASER